MLIEHRSDSVKSKAISIVLLEPESDIGEEESEDLVFGVIKDSAVPQRMIPFLSAMEILEIGSIPHIEALVDIFGSMWVYKIDDDFNIHAVGCIY